MAPSSLLKSWALWVRGLEFWGACLELRDIVLEFREGCLEFRGELLGIPGRDECLEFRGEGLEFRGNGLEFRETLAWPSGTPALEFRENAGAHHLKQYENDAKIYTYAFRAAVWEG